MSGPQVRNVANAEELEILFKDKLFALEICNDLLGAADDEPLHTIQNTKKMLKSIHQSILDLKLMVRNGKENLAEAQKTLKLLSSLKAQAMHASNNLPSCLPSTQCQSKSRPKPDLQNMLPNNHIVDQTPQTKEAPCFPLFLFVTIDEFDKVPKYIKGRLQYEIVNRMVEDLNKALITKYSLLRKHRSKLSISDLKLVNSLRSQNTAETKGRYFVTVDDLKRWCNAKIDTSSRSILTVLRTAKICQEIRGPASLIRYAVPL